jgi:integrase
MSSLWVYMWVIGMTRNFNQLTARGVSTKNKRGRYSDGGGLYLQVSEHGAKSWLYRFMLNGKSRQMGLGSARTFTLAEAREAATECRKLLYEGIDPIEQRKLVRGQLRADTTKMMTFAECAEKYISSHSAGWKNIKHSSQWTNTLSTYAYPVFGDLPVQAVDTGLVMNALEPIWFTKTETAGRVRGRIESVLDWATARKYREGENPARWKGHLDNLLPPRSKVQKVKHHAALPFDEMGTFMVKLRLQEGVSARGLEFQILTAARTGEVIKATWDEIDFGKAVWTVPAERMKVGSEHRVPLSPVALAVLESLKDTALNNFVLPGMRKNTSLSNMAFLKLMERMKVDKGLAVPHGFRSTFRDWASERTAYPREVAEMALAHTVSDKVEAAYRRGDLFDKRRKLMDAWAEYCGGVMGDADGTVVSIGVAQ